VLRHGSFRFARGSGVEKAEVAEVEVVGCCRWGEEEGSDVKDIALDDAEGVCEECLDGLIATLSSRTSGLD